MADEFVMEWTPPLPILATRILSAAASVTPEIAKALTEQIIIVKEIVEPVIKDHTPVGTGPDAGKLRDSTDASVDDFSGLSIDITVSQNALNPGGVPYVGWVIQGRREMIVGQTDGDKEAFFWAGAAHPVKHVKGTDPNPYIEESAAEYGPPYIAAIAESGNKALRGVLALMKV